MTKLFLILIEGLRFLWTIRDRERFLPIPSKYYLWWRLGTVYGLQPTGKDCYPDGTLPPKAFKDLLHEVWEDRDRVASHLLWRRQMRKLANRPTDPPRVLRLFSVIQGGKK